MVSYIDPLYHVKLQVYNQTDKKIAMHGAAFTLTLIDHTVWADIDADTSPIHMPVHHAWRHHHVTIIMQVFEVSHRAVHLRFTICNRSLACPALGLGFLDPSSVAAVCRG